MYPLMVVHYYAVRLLAVISALCVVFLIVAIGAEVIMRSLSLGFVLGIIDFSEYALFFIAILTAPWLLSHNQHIRVDIVLAQLTPSLRRQAEKLVNVAILGVAGTILYYSTLVFLESWRQQETIYREIEIPDWWMQWQIPLAMLLICIELVQRLFWPEVRYAPAVPPWLLDHDENSDTSTGAR